jgi:hypothetical protein
MVFWHFGISVFRCCCKSMVTLSDSLSGCVSSGVFMRILPYISFIDIVSGVVGRGLGLGVVGIRRILIRHNVGIMRRGLKKYAGGFGCLVHRGRRIRVPSRKSSEFMYPIISASPIINEYFF